MPTEDGRCEDCGFILLEADYVRGECGTCGWEIEDE
jgi:hypothetical protein